MLRRFFYFAAKAARDGFDSDRQVFFISQYRFTFTLFNSKLGFLFRFIFNFDFLLDAVMLYPFCI